MNQTLEMGTPVYIINISTIEPATVIDTAWNDDRTVSWYDCKMVNGPTIGVSPDSVYTDRSDAIRAMVKYAEAIATSWLYTANEYRKELDTQADQTREAMERR